MSGENEVVEQTTDETESGLAVEETVAATEGEEETPSSGEGDGSEGGNAGADGEEENAVAAYTPDFKFRAGEQDHEIPEFLRSSITSKEQEGELKDLLSKAYGLDAVKQYRDEIKQERDELQTRFTGVLDSIDQMRDHYARGDLEEVFKILRIEPQKVLQWAVDQAKLSQMPDDQRQVHLARLRSEREAYSSRRESDGVRSEYQSELSRIRENALNTELGKPDVQAVAKAYNDRTADPEYTFRDLVVDTAISVWNRRKVDLGPAEAVALAMKIAGGNSAVAGEGGAGGNQAPNPNTPPVIPAASKKPTIPSVGGGNVSKVKSGPKSIDDLRKIREQKFGS